MAGQAGPYSDLDSMVRQGQGLAQQRPWVFRVCQVASKSLSLEGRRVVGPQVRVLEAQPAQEEDIPRLIRYQVGLRMEPKEVAGQAGAILGALAVLVDRMRRVRLVLLGTGLVVAAERRRLREETAVRAS